MIRPFVYFTHYVFLCVLRLCFRLRIEGKEHLPATGPYIVAANHASYLDPPIIGAIIPPYLRCLARVSLFDVPCVGLCITWLGQIPIRQEGRYDGEAIRTARAVLAQRQKVGVFPEGERSHTGKLQEGKLGIGFLALKANVPIVPVGIIGAHRAFPRGATWPKFSKLHVRIGKPIELNTLIDKDLDKRSRYELAVRLVMQGIAELLPDDYSS